MSDGDRKTPTEGGSELPASGIDEATDDVDLDPGGSAPSGQERGDDAAPEAGGDAAEPLPTDREIGEPPEVPGSGIPRDSVGGEHGGGSEAGGPPGSRRKVHGDTEPGTFVSTLLASLLSLAGMAISAVWLWVFLGEHAMAQMASVGLIAVVGGTAWLYAILSFIDFSSKRRGVRKVWTDVNREYQRLLGDERIKLDVLQGITQHLEASKFTKSIDRMFDRVLAGARDRRLESIVVLMEPVKEETQLRVLQLKSIQQLAIHLGILGTFIGLIVALGNLNLSGDLLRGAALKPLFSNIQIAFATSLAGLVVAILATVLLMVLRGLVGRFHVQLEDTAEHFISLTRKAETPDAFLAEFQQIEEALRDASHRIDSHANMTAYQTKTIKRGLTGLAQVKVDLDTLFEKLAKEQGDFMDRLRSLYEATEPERVIGDMHQSLDRATGRVTEEIRAPLGETAEKLNELGRVTTDLAKYSEQQARTSEEMRRSLEVYRDGLRTTIEGLVSAHESFLGDLDRVITQRAVKLAARSVVQRLFSRGGGDNERPHA